jgi:hypothetical protein
MPLRLGHEEPSVLWRGGVRRDASAMRGNAAVLLSAVKRSSSNGNHPSPVRGDPKTFVVPSRPRAAADTTVGSSDRECFAGGADVPGLQVEAHDQRRLADTWPTFGQRQSPLSGSPPPCRHPRGRDAQLPVRARGRGQARLPATRPRPGPGSDPRRRSRPRLAPARPDGSGAAECRPLPARATPRPGASGPDFHETRRGSVRILAPLTHQLAETCPPGGN